MRDIQITETSFPEKNKPDIQGEEQTRVIAVSSSHLLRITVLSFRYIGLLNPPFCRVDFSIMSTLKMRKLTLLASEGARI